MNLKLNHFCLLLIFSVFIIVLAAGSAGADIYKYVDKDGVLHLTNVPTASNVKYTLVLKEKRVIFLSGLDIKKYDEMITRAAAKYNMDAALIKAVIKAESNFNHQAVSPVGAQGLMQLMPATANAMQVEDAFHPEKNIEGGVRYLSYLIRVYRGNLSLALAAYNAGEGAVSKYNNRIPPFRETQNYVRRVLSYYNKYNK